MILVLSLFLQVALVPMCGAAQGHYVNGGAADSTFGLIQMAIFEGHGCNSAACHGADPGAGGLDLRPEVAYDQLVGVPAQIPGWTRVLGGQATASLLWIKLAAKTFPDQYQTPLDPMPPDPQLALSENELEAIRLWINAGGPATGMVPGVAALLDTATPTRPVTNSPPPTPTRTGTADTPTVKPSPTASRTASTITSPTSTEIPAKSPSPTMTSTTHAKNCPGDCDGDGMVRVNELVTGVNIALDILPISACPQFDTSGNDKVEVNEIIAGVGAALHGCP